MSTLALPVAARPATTRAPAIPVAGWLALGILFTALAGNRFNVALVGWVAAVPWLLALRRIEGWRGWLGLLAALQLGTFLNILKIVTAPIPWFFAPMFSIPMALTAFVVYALFEWQRRRLGDGWGLILFPALSVVTDALGAYGSEMGSWGSLAYTQLDNLPLLQVTSVFGLTGVTLLLSGVSALTAVLIARSDRRAWLPHTVALGALVLAVHAWGAVRMDRVLSGPHATVATVTTDVHLTPEGLPSQEVIDRGTDALFDRTAAAVAAGAELVVWNEGATAVTPAQESGFLERAQTFVAALGVDVVFAYIVPLEDGPYRYENKYVWMTPEGPLETYFKHHPVPGEGAVPGLEPLVAHERPYGTAAGAICYDYDFPEMGRTHAELDVGLVVVPASDWRGIDPYHSQMAAVRGIEGGFSVIRPVRWATSLATDGLGRVRGSASWFEGERVLLARVPTTRIDTIYSHIGEALPLSGLVVWLGGLGLAIRRRR